MKTNIGISAKTTNSIHKVLNTCLADENLLYVKVRKFHWKVSGRSFMEIHKLLDEQYEAIAEAADQIAERISKLGGMAIGTMSEFTKMSSIKENPDKNPEQESMLKELTADHETIINSLRQVIDKEEDLELDAVTTDFLTGFMEQHETMAWKLRRYLQ